MVFIFTTLQPVSYTHLDVYKRQTIGCGENRFASAGIDEPLEGPLRHYRETCRITKNPYILSFMNISCDQDGSTGEAANENACIVVAKVVMLRHRELPAGLAMDHPRPTRKAFQNMAVGKNPVSYTHLFANVA